MNVCTHIETALVRGGSPYTLDFVLHELWAGALKLWIGDHMSASAWIRDDGIAEIVHVGGQWDDDDARWMLDGLKAWCAEKGTTWAWRGRAGWVRFLKRRKML
jgi:hypothetical protein